MKLLHIADIHEGATLFGYKREAAMHRALSFVLEKAEAEQPDCAIIAGDLFHTKNPSQSSRERINTFLCNLGDICPVLVLAGNHDNARLFCADYRPFLSSRVTMLSYESLQEEHMIEHPFLFDGNGIGITALPWIPDMYLRNYASKYLITVQEVLPRLFCEGNTEIIAGHGTVSGAKLPQAVSEDLFPPDMSATFLDRFSYAAFGHIHLPQQIASLRYSGSLFALDFSENFPHILTFFDTDDKRLLEYPIPQTETLLTIPCDSLDISLPNDDTTYWLKIVWSGETREDLRRELEERLPENCKLICVQHKRDKATESLSPFVAGEELPELVPEDVFDRLLEARKVLIDRRLPLRRAFSQLLRRVSASTTSLQ